MEEQSFRLQDSTPTTDIYGTRLVERLSDIYACIQDGAEDMENQMCCSFPKPSPEGRMEMEIIMAAILSREVEKGIVLQSLLAGNSSYNTVGLTNISEIMDARLKTYRFYVLEDYVQERHTLKELMKANDKLVLKGLKDPDESGNVVSPIFIKDGIEAIRCRFWYFEKKEQTAEFIRNNYSSIVVDKTIDGEYLFKQQRDIDSLFIDEMKYIAYDIYCAPLFHKSVLTSIERDQELGGIKRRASNVIILKGIQCLSAEEVKESSDIGLQVGYALQEGVRTMGVMTSSLGITGKLNKQNEEEENLPF